MKLTIKSFVLLLVFAFNAKAVMGQIAEDFVFKVTTIINEDPPSFTFTWDTMPVDSVITICRKNKYDTEWGDPIAVLQPDAIQFIDNDVEAGVEYEYRILKESNIMSPNAPLKNYTSYDQWLEDWCDGCEPSWPYIERQIVTYISSGIEMPELEYRGKVILLVDSNFVDSLRSELTLFETDLLADGWKVLRKDISRDASVTYVKSVVRDFYFSDTVNVKSLILFGHIPVPYSGCYAPDGHLEEAGAWQADLYYGSMNEDIWTDEIVNLNNPVLIRDENDNIPGDGKFDISMLPEDENIRLQIGRIDLSKLPAFSKSEAELLRNYLNKNHAYRYRKIYPKIQALIKEYDGWNNPTIGPLSVTGWRNFVPLVKTSNINEDNYVQGLREDSYIWSYGDGPGTGLFTGTSVGDVVTTDQFVEYSLKNVFTAMFGSESGNWDYKDNVLRAALASEGWTLTNCPAGWPL